ncbi:MAG TPA: hypothetical protein VIK61_13810 [Acidimicrobiia bacterium]
MTSAPLAAAARAGSRRPVARRRAVRAGSVLVGLAVAGSLVAGGCGSHRQATGFCAAIEQGRAAFDSTDEAHLTASLAEFDRVAANAPAAIAPELKTVSAFLRLLLHDPKSAATAAVFVRYSTAVRRVDRYLHETCGIHIPPQGKFL